MLESLKATLKGQCPRLEKLHAAFVSEICHIVDSYYAHRPFPPRKAVQTPFGFKLAGGNSLHHKAMQEGRFEPDEVALVQHLLASADVFVDVGANIGFYTCLARYLGKQAIAVEPQAGNLRYLFSNLLANGWDDTEVFPVGVGTAPGLVPLYGSSSTGASLIPGWAGSPRRVRRVIPVSTLDDLLGSRFRGKKLLIKIDVEGAEYDVLRGAEGLLTSSPRPVWLVEICRTEHHPDGMNLRYEDTFRLFLERGYRTVTAEKDPRPVSPAEIHESYRSGSVAPKVINYVFTSEAS